MDEIRSATPLSPAPDETPSKPTRNTAAVATSLTPGESREYPQVPGYEILGILGHGGMGVVYRARQLKANRLVALKMIRAIEHATPHDRVRFQIETEAVARLQHPNVVQLHEVGEVRGQPFFSLEFCDGGTLTEQLKRQRPTPMEAARLIETLARAMHYAHLRGVVHRDLKPGNVLLASAVVSATPGSSRGADAVPLAKITDFGLAKRIDAEARDVSQSGAIMGTASYMAPEQAAGKVHDTGPAADVYALGALLYECLTGRPPFEGAQYVVLVKVLNEEPEPPSRRAQVPADLETICLKCLSKEPARRYASAEDLADDLRRFQVGEPVQARPIGRLERTGRWCRRHPGIATLTAMSFTLLLTVAIGATIAAIRIDHLREEADRARLHAQEAERERSEQLWQAQLERVRTGRVSRLVGHRFGSLKAIRAAAGYRASLDLRNEAIACLALVDLAPAPAGTVFPPPQWIRRSPGLSVPDTDPASGRKAVPQPNKREVAILAPDGKEERRLVHPDQIDTVLWRRDGRLLAVSCINHTVHIWRMPAGERLTVLEGHQHGIYFYSERRRFPRLTRITGSQCLP